MYCTTMILILTSSTLEPAVEEVLESRDPKLGTSIKISPSSVRIGLGAKLQSMIAIPYL